MTVRSSSSSSSSSSSCRHRRHRRHHCRKARRRHRRLDRSDNVVFFLFLGFRTSSSSSRSHRRPRRPRLHPRRLRPRPRRRPHPRLHRPPRQRRRGLLGARPASALPARRVFGFARFRRPRHDRLALWADGRVLSEVIESGPAFRADMLLAEVSVSQGRFPMLGSALAMSARGCKALMFRGARWRPAWLSTSPQKALRAHMRATFQTCRPDRWIGPRARRQILLAPGGHDGGRRGRRIDRHGPAGGRGRPQYRKGRQGAGGGRGADRTGRLDDRGRRRQRVLLAQPATSISAIREPAPG